MVDDDSTISIAVPLDKEAIATACRRYGARYLDLFGSAVSGTFDPDRSDIDAVVDFDAVPGLSRFDAYFGLIEALEAVFGRPVDLVTHKSMRNPYFIRAVERQRTRVYP